MPFRIVLSLALAFAPGAFPQECSYQTIAGLPVTHRGDDGPVAQALFNGPSAVAITESGAIYIADTGNHRVRRIDPGGMVRPMAGTGEQAFHGDGGPAVAAALRSPRGLAVTPDGALYIADTGNHRVRRVSPNGVIQTVAGQGQALFGGDGGPATAATLNSPTQLAFDGAGALYILDSGNARIRRVDADGTIRTVAGARPLLDYWPGVVGDIVEGSPAASAENLIPHQFGVTAEGTLYINSGNHIWRVASDGLLRLWLAIQFSPREQNLDGSVPVDQLVVNSGSIVVASDGTIYINTGFQLIAVRDGVAMRLSDSLGFRQFAIAPVSGDAIAVSSLDLIRHVPGGSRTTLWTSIRAPAALPASAVGLPITPRGIATGPDGTLYIAERSRILTLDREGQLRLFAGSPTGSAADGTPALDAALSGVRSLAVDGEGTVYFTEPGVRRVRKIGADGLVRRAFTTPEEPAWIRVDGQNRVYVFAARGSLSQLIRYDPDGTPTVLMRDTSGGGFFWPGVSGAEDAPGMTVAKDGTVYLGITAFLANSTSTVLKLVPGQNQRLVPMEERFYSAAMTVGEDGILYLAARNGRIKKILADGTMVTVRNRDDLGFWGEHGFDSAPAAPTRIHDLLIDGRGDLLAADSAVRMMRLPCALEPGPELIGIRETATSNPRLRLAAGQLISLYGFRLGPDSPLTAAPDATGHYPTELDGTRVLIDGVVSPLLFAGKNQVNAIVPFAIDGQTTVPVEILRNGRRSGVVSTFLGRTGPAIFSYPGPEFFPDLYVRMLNEDGSINGRDTPAKLGSVVTVYVSGLGITSPAGEDGKIADLNFKRPIHPVSLRVESQDAEILYAGTAPGIVEGVFQINFRLPKTLPGRGGCCANIGIGIAEGVPQPNRLLFYFTP